MIGTRRSVIAFLAPLFFCGAVVAGSLWIGLPTTIWQSLFVGLGIAYIQTAVSTGLLFLMWDKSGFYWVWGGLFLARMGIFAITAFVVYRQAALNFATTLLSLALGTTIFLVTEAWLVLRRENK